jgi:molybdopterin converting factor subunit 1
VKIRVLLFAQAKQLARADFVEVNIDTEPKVSGLRDALGKQYPDLEDLLSRSSIAINQEYAVADDVVPRDAEVAMIPPVSGG